MNPFSWIVGNSGNRTTSPRQPIPETFLQVSNLTRQTVLATRMELANSGPKRNKGLLGRNHLAPGEGLWIVPCESVHTFFMQFPIDLIYLDREKRIRKLRSAVPPWRMSVCLTAHSILELPAGTIRNSQTQRGDTLEFSPVAEPGDSAASE
jgi:uncharacterized membrane protein (UPF0127 family)